MDILFADDLKREVRLGLWLFLKRVQKDYGVTVEQMEDDLENCGNPVIAKMWDVIKSSSKQIKESYQREMSLQYPMVILWIVYKDTAYANPFFHMLNRIIEDEKLCTKAKEYDIPVKDWYVNRWHDTKEHTRLMKEKGELADVDGVMSQDEQIFVPKYQAKAAYELNKALDEEKKRRGWINKNAKTKNR